MSLVEDRLTFTVAGIFVSPDKAFGVLVHNEYLAKLSSASPGMARPRRAHQPHDGEHPLRRESVRGCNRQSIAIGLRGGLPPALRAARLGVIEAMKHA